MVLSPGGLQGLVALNGLFKFWHQILQFFALLCYLILLCQQTLCLLVSFVQVWCCESHSSPFIIINLLCRFFSFTLLIKRHRHACTHLLELVSYPLLLQAHGRMLGKHLTRCTQTQTDDSTLNIGSKDAPAHRCQHLQPPSKIINGLLDVFHWVVHQGQKVLGFPTHWPFLFLTNLLPVHVEERPPLLWYFNHVSPLQAVFKASTREVSINNNQTSAQQISSHVAQHLRDNTLDNLHYQHALLYVHTAWCTEASGQTCQPTTHLDGHCSDVAISIWIWVLLLAHLCHLAK